MKQRTVQTATRDRIVPVLCYRPARNETGQVAEQAIQYHPSDEPKEEPLSNRRCEDALVLQ